MVAQPSRNGRRSPLNHAHVHPEPTTALAGLGCLRISAAGWTRPVLGQVGSGFRAAARPTHYGIDFTDGRGTAVRAAAAGIVTLVACQATLGGAPYSCDVDGSPEVSGCEGWYLNILHLGGAVTRYCHLLTRPPVNVGEQVAARQPIGQIGSSGNSSGPHLHFEIELRRVIDRQAGSVTIERRQTDPMAFYAAQGIVIECATSAHHCQPAHGDRVRTEQRPG